LSNQKCYANQEEIIIMTDWNLRHNNLTLGYSFITNWVRTITATCTIYTISALTHGTCYSCWIISNSTFYIDITSLKRLSHYSNSSYGYILSQQLFK
jgi:hypothetical protein